MDCKNTAFSITKNGKKHQFSYCLDTSKMTQSSIARCLDSNRLYEAEESLFLMQILDEGDCFIDVGANVGYFTVIAAHLVGDRGTVFAFEPEQTNFDRLTQNIRLNNLTNVRLNNVAVGADDRSVELFVNSDNEGGHALWNPGDHSYNVQSRAQVIKQTVNQMMLDTVFASEISLPKIKLLKIDTEGYEHQVMIGALDTVVRRRIPFILAEVNRLGLRKSGSSEAVFRSYMHNLGYIGHVSEVLPDQRRVYTKLPQAFIPLPENKEAIYNILFALPGELERANITVY